MFLYNYKSKIDERKKKVEDIRFPKLEDTIYKSNILSNAEKEVTKLKIQGLTDKEVSELLNKSKGTVEVQWKKVRSKLDCKNVVEVIKVLASEG